MLRRHEKLTRTLGEAEVEALIEQGATDARERAVLELLYTTGLLASELVSPTLDDAAHPNPTLLNLPEAMLVANAARAILHYLGVRLRGSCPPQARDCLNRETQARDGRSEETPSAVRSLRRPLDHGLRRAGRVACDEVVDLVQIPERTQSPSLFRQYAACDRASATETAQPAARACPPPAARRDTRAASGINGTVNSFQNE